MRPNIVMLMDTSDETLAEAAARADRDAFSALLSRHYDRIFGLAFRLTGSLERSTGRLVLKQQRWIEQPNDPSYRMVDLEGILQITAGQALIRGQVTSYGCQDFAVWQFFTEVGGER